LILDNDTWLLMRLSRIELFRPYTEAGTPTASREPADRTGPGDGSVNEQPVQFLTQMREFLRRHMSLLLLAGLVLLLVQDVFGTHGVLAMRRAQKETARVKREIEQIDTENRRLEDNVRSLKSDPEAIERIAREEMGLARPGEYIFKLPSKLPEAFVPPSQSVDSSKRP